MAGVEKVVVVTRLFEAPELGGDYALPWQRVGPKVTIERIATGNRAYLEKAALAAEIDDFAEAFCDHLAGLETLPDVIHAHFADAARIAGVARRRFGIPFVYTAHALGLDRQSSEPANPDLHARIGLEREAIAAADAIIVSTRDEAERQVAAYGVAQAGLRIERITPGVPQFSVGSGAAGLELGAWLDDPGKPIVLAIARPVRKKNLVALVRAFAECGPLREAANLVVIAGQHGSLVRSAEEQSVLAALLRACADPRICGRVALPPRHSAGDVHALYAKAAAGGVFVNPALHEPFGLTLIEAAAMGVPVVATRNGGPVDILATTRHGVLVDPLDVAAIAAACLRIVTQPALHARLAQAGRDHAPLFSWARYAERSVGLYASLERRAGVKWRAGVAKPFVVAGALTLQPEVAGVGVLPGAPLRPWA